MNARSPAPAAALPAGRPGADPDGSAGASPRGTGAAQGIVFEHVAKRFGAVEVIPDFSLRIEPGEFVALLGPSGCGKSTLLRMLAGLEPVSSGRIVLGGRDVTHLPPGQRGVAMVFQQYALYPTMTVRENMSFGLRNLRTPPAEIARRVDAAAAMLELQPLLERRPAQLSGGQRQRVAIGRAVVKEPAAFLLDEPMSNLDASLRTRTRVELARLHRRLGATMLLVTHDQVEAMTLADRIVVMNGGRIEQVDAPMAMYARPASRFVAGFVGSPAMAFVPLRRLADAADAVDAADAAQAPQAAAGAASGPAAGGAPQARFELPGGALLPAGLALPPGKDGWSLGLRPESLRLVDAERVGGAGGSRAAGAIPPLLHGTLEVVERLGDRTLAHVALPDGTRVVADAHGHVGAAHGGRVGLAVDTRTLHFFDADGRAHRRPEAAGDAAAAGDTGPAWR